MGNYAHAWILVAFFVTTDLKNPVRYTEAIRECSMIGSRYIHNVVQFYCSTTTWLLCMHGCVHDKQPVVWITFKCWL